MLELSWSKRGLLVARNESGRTVYTWTYSDFERMLPHAVTPSMYHFMCSYILTNVSLEQDEYRSDGIEARAIDAYYDLPYEDRLEMHAQETVNLQVSADKANKQLDAIIEAKLAFMYENDALFPISDDAIPMLERLEKKYEKMYDYFLSEMCIEETWYNICRD